MTIRNIGDKIHYTRGLDIASATELPLFSDGDFFHVTGTTTITSLKSLGKGMQIVLKFDDILTLTYHATDLILPTVGDITTAAGDAARFIEYDLGKWKCIEYIRLDGSPIIGMDHASLSNLDYASAGHTGFAASGANSDITSLTSLTSLSVDGDVVVGTPDGESILFINKYGVGAPNATIAAGEIGSEGPIGMLLMLKDSDDNAFTSLHLRAAGEVYINNGQIEFPATVNASTNVNTLDDYEEGTWTPGFSFDFTTTGITYDSQVGSYTKIGNRLLFSGYIDLSSKGTATGDVRITGLPFVSKDTQANLNAIALRGFDMTFVGMMTCYCLRGTTELALQELHEDGVWDYIDDVNMADTSRLIFSGCYTV